MAIATGTALLGSALIGGAASVAAGNKAAKAATQGAQQGADAMLQASREANALQQRMFDTTWAAGAPWRQAGVQALGNLQGFMGMSPGASAGVPNAGTNIPNSGTANYGGTPTPVAGAPGGAMQGGTNPAYQSSGAINTQMPGLSPTMSAQTSGLTGSYGPGQYQNTPTDSVMYAMAPAVGASQDPNRANLNTDLSTIAGNRQISGAGTPVNALGSYRGGAGMVAGTISPDQLAGAIDGPAQPRDSGFRTYEMMEGGRGGAPMVSPGGANSQTTQPVYSPQTAQPNTGANPAPGAQPATDPFQQFLNSTNYQFTYNQGENALQRLLARSGQLSSGRGMTAAIDYGQNMAHSNAIMPYMNQLNVMSGLGQNSAMQGGNQAIQTGNIMGNNIMSAGNAAGNALAQGGMNRASAYQNTGNAISNLFNQYGMWRGYQAGMLPGGP